MVKALWEGCVTPIWSKKITTLQVLFLCMENHPQGIEENCSWINGHHQDSLASLIEGHSPRMLLHPWQAFLCKFFWDPLFLITKGKLCIYIFEKSSNSLFLSSNLPLKSYLKSFQCLAWSWTCFFFFLITYLWFHQCRKFQMWKLTLHTA